MINELEGLYCARPEVGYLLKLYLEANCVSSLAAVHVVAEAEDDLQPALQPLAPLNLLGTLQNRLQKHDKTQRFKYFLVIGCKRYDPRA